MDFFIVQGLNNAQNTPKKSIRKIMDETKKGFEILL